MYINKIGGEILFTAEKGQPYRWREFLCYARPIADEVVEPSVLRFDNTVFPQPARHNLKLCYARPIATDVVEPSV